MFHYLKLQNIQINYLKVEALAVQIFNKLLPDVSSDPANHNYSSIIN